MSESPILLQRDGHAVNHKKLYRLYRAEGLMVRRRQRKRLAGAALRPGGALLVSVPHTASRPISPPGKKSGKTTCESVLTAKFE